MSNLLRRFTDWLGIDPKPYCIEKDTRVGCIIQLTETINPAALPERLATLTRKAQAKRSGGHVKKRTGKS